MVGTKLHPFYTRTTKARSHILYT